MHVTPESFDDWLDERSQPHDWPGDESAFAVDDESSQRAVWSVADDGTAAWAARRVARAREEIERAGRLAALQRQQIDEFVEKVQREHGRTIAFFEDRLREYHADRIAERGPKESKTVRVPGFRLQSRVGSVATKVTDEDALRAWIETNRLGDSLLGEPKPPPVVLNAVKARFEPDEVSVVPGSYDAKVLDDDPLTKGGKRARAAAGDVVPGVEFVRGEEWFGVVPETEV